MASDRNPSSVPSSTPSFYPPNTGASRSRNSTTSVLSLYDHEKQVGRAAVRQALADPALAEWMDLMKRAARVCQMRRTQNGTCGYATQVCLQKGLADPSTVAMAECRLETEDLPNDPFGLLITKYTVIIYRSPATFKGL